MATARFAHFRFTFPEASIEIDLPESIELRHGLMVAIVNLEIEKRVAMYLESANDALQKEIRSLYLAYSKIYDSSFDTFDIKDFATVERSTLDLANHPATTDPHLIHFTLPAGIPGLSSLKIEIDLPKNIELSCDLKLSILIIELAKLTALYAESPNPTLDKDMESISILIEIAVIPGKIKAAQLGIVSKCTKFLNQLDKDIAAEEKLAKEKINEKEKNTAENTSKQDIILPVSGSLFAVFGNPTVRHPVVETNQNEANEKNSSNQSYQPG